VTPPADLPLTGRGQGRERGLWSKRLGASPAVERPILIAVAGSPSIARAEVILWSIQIAWAVIHVPLPISFCSCLGIPCNLSAQVGYGDFTNDFNGGWVRSTVSSHLAWLTAFGFLSAGTLVPPGSRQNGTCESRGEGQGSEGSEGGE
jgi:hypothetical protein